MNKIRGRVMKKIKVGKLIILATASAALVTTLIKDKKNTKDNLEN